jgi:hypothetical protein
MIMAKNPTLSFALEESFSFKSTYPNAAPLGPIMELGVPDVQKTFTAEAAAQTVEYWRTASQSLLADSETARDSTVLRAYSKMATAQAKLLEDHNLSVGQPSPGVQPDQRAHSHSYRNQLDRARKSHAVRGRTDDGRADGVAEHVDHQD